MASHRHSPYLNPLGLSLKDQERFGIIGSESIPPASTINPTRTRTGTIRTEGLVLVQARFATLYDSNQPRGQGLYKLRFATLYDSNQARKEQALILVSLPEWILTTIPKIGQAFRFAQFMHKLATKYFKGCSREARRIWDYDSGGARNAYFV